MRLRVCLSLSLLLAGFAFAQNPDSCGKPPAMLQSTQPNIFSEQQEQWLGEAMADQGDRFYRPVRNPALNASLETIGKRLLAALPPTSLQFHFTLVESSELNGFSLAGGRVYLTRKLVASAHSEDEIAGVIAHEMGHILTHQFAIETTADLKRLLNITSVGDRADIYAKYQLLVDARLHDKHPTDPDDDDKQDQADRVAVYAAATAGYRPQAYSELMDRVLFTGGKTGSRFSDFFGSTTPSQKRLRRVRALVAELPSACNTRPLAAATTSFQTWQHQVLEDQAIAASAAAGSEGDDLALTPAIRMDVANLRFSRDGRLVLAQDESTVHVLTRNPFEEIFRLPADNAFAAEFSPDSTEITFTTRTLHVERWSIAGRKLIDAHELVSPDPCLQVKLSPDGRTLMCLSASVSLNDYVIDLTLYDVPTGNVVERRKAWIVLNYFNELWGIAARVEAGNPEPVVGTALSPDGNTLMVGTSVNRLAFDLRTRTPIKLSGALHNAEYAGAASFSAEDKVLLIHTANPADSGIFSFPDGSRLATFKLGVPFLHATTSSNLVITQGPRDLPVALIDPAAGKYVLSSRSRTLDAYGDTFVSENIDGSLTLARLNGDIKGNATAKLTLSPLASAYAVSLSPDGRYLAYSGRTRGAVWDTETGRQAVLVRGFRAATWTSDNKLIGLFPGRDKEPRVMREITLTPASSRDLLYKLSDHAVLESGHLLEWKQDKKVYTLTASSPRDNTVQWTRTFNDGRPSYTTNIGNSDLILSYRLDSPQGREKLRTDPGLKTQAAAVKERAYARIVEIVDSANGKPILQVVVEVPRSYDSVDGWNRVGDLLYLNTGDNRVIVYSLSSGKQLRQLFGDLLTADDASGTICTNNRRDEVSVIDQNGTELRHLSLGVPLRFASLRNRGTQLILMTADQHLHHIDLTSAKP